MKENKSLHLNFMLKKLFLPLLIYSFLVLAPITVYATTYYVDSDITDTNVGSAMPDFTTYDHTNFTTGSGTDSVYKTVADINAGSFSSDDQILFRKGLTWREQLTIPSSGTTGHPILFGSFGSGSKPKIYGSSAITSWSNSNISAETGDTLNESFEATGYDNAGWTETVGSGSFVDEDSTAIARPSDGGNQELLIQKVSPNFNAKTRYDLGSAKPIMYARVLSNWTANGLGNATSIRVMAGFDNSGSLAWYVTFNKTAGGTTGYQFYYFTNGGWSNSTVQTSYGSSSTWYKHEVKYDATNMTYEWRINGSSIVSGSLTGTVKAGTRYIDLGDASNSYTVTMYLDRFAIDTSKYLEDTLTIPANIYYSSISSQPTVAWFKETNGTVSYGDGPKTYTSNFSNLVNEYDWLYYNSRVFVYSPTDPNSRYSSMEASIRNYGINGNVKSYITIDGIEIGYTAQYGVSTGTGGINFIFQNNTIHHIGIRNGTYGEGIHIRGSNS